MIVLAIAPRKPRAKHLGGVLPFTPPVSRAAAVVRGAGFSSRPFLPINLGVERWVIVHFALAISAMTHAAGKDIAQQLP